MQPNQQDPNAQPGVPQSPASAPTQPLPYQVPDYLGLEPYSPPGTSSGGRKKLVTILFVALILIIFAALGIFAYIYSHRDTPEAKFDRALNRQMQLGGIERTFISTNKQGQTVTVKARTVFGDWDKVKTSLSYTSSDSNEQCEQVLDKAHFSLRCHTPSEALKGLGIKSDVWYQMNMPASGEVNQYDELELQQAVNSPFDIVPIGNIDQQNRDKIMDALRRDQVYMIKSTRADTLDGQGIDLYDVSIDMPKMNSLWQFLASTLHVTKPYALSTYAGSVSSMTVWVNGNDEIVKVKFSIGSKQQDVSVLYASSGPSQDIATPQSVRAFPQGVK